MRCVILSALGCCLIICAGCAHDDYLAYRQASLWADLIAAMECSPMAITGTQPPDCQRTRHWASMHVAGY